MDDDLFPTFGDPRGGTGGGTLCFTIDVFFFNGGMAADVVALDFRLLLIG